MAARRAEHVPHPRLARVRDERPDRRPRRVVAVRLAGPGRLVGDPAGERPVVEPDRLGVGRRDRVGAQPAVRDLVEDPRGVLVGEPLVDPAPDEQVLVEPGVRRLVDDRELVEVLADLDQALVGVEDAGVALEQRRVDLGDLDVAGHRPVEAELVDELRQPGPEQPGDAGLPLGVLGPGADDEMLAARQVEPVARERVLAVRDDRRVPVGRIVDAGRRDRGDAGGNRLSASASRSR